MFIRRIYISLYKCRHSKKSDGSITDANIWKRISAENASNFTRKRSWWNTFLRCCCCNCIQKQIIVPLNWIIHVHSLRLFSETNASEKNKSYQEITATLLTNTYLLMLWWPFNLLQSNKRTVPSVLALAKSDELELSAVNFVTDDLCSCRWAISVPFMLWPAGIIDARFIAAFESLFAFSSTYWLFSLLCSICNSLRQSELRSLWVENKF